MQYILSDFFTMLWCFPPVYLDHFHFNVGVYIVQGESKVD